MPYVGIYFGHAMSKACQYAIMDEKVCINMLEVNTCNIAQVMLGAQVTLQKTIKWTKNSRKGRQ